MTPARKIALQFLKKKAVETSSSPEELTELSDFLASQVSSMDDASVAYASYVCEGIPGQKQNLIATLYPKLLLSYRKRLVEWFEHALVKRANLGGGGIGITRMEKGLADFVKAIPNLILKRQAFSLTQFVPENDYLDPEMMDRVAQKIARSVWTEAQQVGLLKDPTGLESWFRTWYAGNCQRITKVFTDYAKNKQSSYKLLFQVGPGGEPEVSFERNIRTAWEAVEELRYRYTGRQGREPWLEVLDMFVELVKTTSPARLPRIIDRINNLQHSNGLFMEHFPASVKAWYEEFLNAKYSAPRPDDLARYIPDRDLRSLLIDVARSGYRPFGWAFNPPGTYHTIKKTLEGVGATVNWRAKGYPRHKGEKGLQVDRFSDTIQHGLDVLRKLDKQREALLSIEPATPTEYQDWKEKVDTWSSDYEKAVQNVENLAQKADPEITENLSVYYPWMIPGVRSELLPFLRERTPKEG
jgi:hypothetical protein